MTGHIGIHATHCPDCCGAASKWIFLFARHAETAACEVPARNIGIASTFLLQNWNRRKAQEGAKLKQSATPQAVAVGSGKAVAVVCIACTVSFANSGCAVTGYLQVWMRRIAEAGAKLKQAKEHEVYGLASMEVQQRRAARRDAKAAMRQRRAVLECGEGMAGDAGTQSSADDRLHKLARATAADRERWAANRARPTSPVGVGCTDGTLASLARVHEIVHACTNAVCGGLVSGQAAPTLRAEA